MLEGEKLNLRIIEREDLLIVKRWVNDYKFMGQYEPILQETRTSLEKQYDRLTEGQWFFVEKKDGSKIGYMCHYLTGAKITEIGYAIVPGERGRGYGTEAVMIMVDYLFLSKNISRIQVQTDEENRASQRRLPKS